MTTRFKSEKATVIAMRMATIMPLLIVSFMASVCPAKAFNFKPFSKPQKPTGNAASTQAASAIHDKWAVLIGVSNFKDANIPPIKYGSESAGKLGRVFLDPRAGHFRNDHMVVLQQDDATRATIEDVLANGVVSKALPTDLIVLYISSRWAPSKNGKQAVFCGNDTTLANIDESGLDLANILSTVRRRTQSRNIVCFLDLSPVKEGSSSVVDSLFSNSSKTKSAPAGVIERLAEQTNVSVLSANDLVNNSAQTPFTESSYFCRFLMEDLKGTSGTATVASLEHMIADQVHATVRSEQKVEQLPQSYIVSETLPNLAIGLVFAKQKIAPAVAFLPPSLANAKFGIEAGRMPIEHPELLPGAGIGTPVTPVQKNARQAATRQSVQVAQAQPATAKTDKTDNEDDDQPSSDLDLTPYITAAKKTIQAKWQPPKGLENHRAVTIFTILRDGTITDPQMEEPSGIAAVDQAAIDALKAASPLPPLPAGSPKSIQLRYKFQWKVTHQ